MTSEDLKAAFERIWDGVWHSKDATQVIEDNFTDDFKIHISPVPQDLDKETYKGFVANWQQAFPDGRMNIIETAVQGDRVWCYWVSTGTHSDTYLNVPATGKQVRYEGADVFRMVDGKVAQVWDIPDALSLMQQLGAIPSG